ncbi:MAG: Membrane spanning protein [Candidatus Jorgensenbacteria bacterium GW2011_GWA2_45_13]|uniref:Membrane spanning protein n=1 Tax=Candidatus Jorgensenbacteria bacterium GW2011_GWA2_45_13 TaxID=1618662 RepID=A0A0G1L4C3_9BACT|nr:MAG: Membrane spanning protein [Candidatus Jorgensenbacteria bacterium GW2011_GWA2_45_13]
MFFAIYLAYMKFLTRFIFRIISNALGIFVATKFIPGIIFSGTLWELVVAALILTLINAFIRPVLKLIFGPLIVLTFGLFVIIVNAMTLYILDIVSQPLTIQGYLPLIYASLIIGIINFVIGASGKLAYKQ